MSSQWLPSFCMALSGGHTSTRTFFPHRDTLHGIFTLPIRKTHRNSLRISKTHISVNALDTNSSHPTNFQKNPKIAFIFLSFATGYVAMGMYEQPMSAMSCRNFLSSCTAYLPISLKTVRICLLFSNWTSLCSHDGWHKLHLLLNQLEWRSNPSVITSLTGYVADTLRHYATKDTKSARIVANSSYSSSWISFGHRNTALKNHRHSTKCRTLDILCGSFMLREKPVSQWIRIQGCRSPSCMSLWFPVEVQVSIMFKASWTHRILHIPYWSSSIPSSGNNIPFSSIAYCVFQLIHLHLQVLLQSAEKVGFIAGGFHAQHGSQSMGVSESVISIKSPWKVQRAARKPIYYGLMLCS